MNEREAAYDKIDRQPRHCNVCHGNGHNCPECGGWDDGDSEQ